MDQIKRFYSKVVKEHPNTETANLLIENPDCGFFELCQSFLYIALNAPIIQNDDGSLSGVFQFADIDTAKAKAIKFIKENGITNFEEFFLILERHYPFSASPNDTRQKSGIVREKNPDVNGYAGTLYFFTNISDNVYTKMVKSIKDDLQKECQ